MTGINFPQDYRLSKYDDLKDTFDLKHVISMIEKSFNYKESHKLSVDFYPLFTKENLENSHYLLFKDKVIGAIFCSNRKINVNDIELSTACLGGIFITEQHRGQGLFKPFFSQTLKNIQQKSNPDLFMLWSEKTRFYENLNFLNSGSTYYEYPSTPLNKCPDGFQKSSFDRISPVQFEKIKTLYESELITSSFRRDHKDWENIKNITSINLFYHTSKNGDIEGYFLKDKGMDLGGVIHEFTNDPITKKTIKPFSKITPYKPSHSDYSLIPSAMVKVLNEDVLNVIDEIYCNGADCV